jgi:hypothetical protein
MQGSVFDFALLDGQVYIRSVYHHAGNNTITGIALPEDLNQYIMETLFSERR